MALHGPQGIGFHVFVGHKPGLMLAYATLAPGLRRLEVCAFGLDAAYAKPLALAQRVKAQANV